MSAPTPARARKVDHGTPLSEQDYKALEARWITRELADSAQLRRVDDQEGALTRALRPRSRKELRGAGGPEAMAQYNGSDRSGQSCASVERRLNWERVQAFLARVIHSFVG